MRIVKFKYTIWINSNKRDLQGFRIFLHDPQFQIAYSKFQFS